MKRLALSMVAAAAAALSSSAAFAEPVPSVTLGGYYDRTGPYIGGNGGAAWSGDRTVTAQKWFMEMPISDLAFGSRHVSGGFGGGQVGYNYQVSNFVFGVEANARGGSIHGGSSDETRASFFGRTGSIRLSTSECIGFFSTVVGRVGYSWDRVLFYATAGGAFGQTNTRMISSFGADAAARMRRGVAGLLSAVASNTPSAATGAQTLIISTLTQALPPLGPPNFSEESRGTPPSQLPLAMILTL